MTWLQFISEMVGHLAWPIVGLVIVFAVRKHLGALVERVLELSFGGATVKFDKLLSKGAEIIEQVSPRPELPSTKSPSSQKIEDELQKEWLQEIQDRVDVGQMLATYATIDKLIMEIGDAVGVRGRISEVFRYLCEKDLIHARFATLYATLSEGRNVVAHGQTKLSQREIEEYVRQASYLRATLSLLLDQIRSGEIKVPPA